MSLKENDYHPNYEPKENYAGEKQKQLRHGYGVYNYDNKFYKYEGQWKNGLKHGHGKLSMADGSYYKGTFVNGEIEGHGFRLFAINGSTYSGQFHLGEMSGQGIYKTPQGLHYEGGWQDNKREGQGILTEPNGSVYDGDFHNHKRHGKGIQLYSNGDRYEGEWVQNKRQGQGMYRTADGTIYDGQWLSDVYHGQGTMYHCSGMVYTGIWSNGSPTVETAQLKTCGTDILKVTQDKVFSITLQCYDSNGEPTNLDNGRKLEVTAAFCISKEKILKRSLTKLNIPKSKSTGEDVSTVFTPFGEALAYELLQKLPTVESRPVTPLPTHDNSLTPSELNNDNKETSVKADALNSALLAGANTVLSQSTHAHIAEKPSALAAIRGTSPLAVQSMYAANKPPSDSPTEMEAFIDSLVPPGNHYTKDGMVTFTDLYFPPPLLPSAISKDSSFASTESINSIASEDEAKRKATEKMARKSPHLSPLHSTSQRLPAKKKQPRSPVKGGKSSSPQGNRASVTPPKSPNRARKKESVVAVSRSKVQMSPENRFRKEKLLQPKRQAHCWLGTYVLIITDVTEPPFFDKKLPKCYCKVQVVGSSKEQAQEEKMRFERDIESILQHKQPPLPLGRKLRKSMSSDDNKK